MNAGEMKIASTRVDDGLREQCIRPWSLVSFIIGVEGSFGTETRYDRDNKSRGTRERRFSLSLSRLWKVYETIDRFASFYF